MLVLPAVDIRGGKAVRLIQGERRRERVYDDDPVAAARRWTSAGARWLHVVDLDGAFAGSPGNPDAVGRILAEAGVPVEVGGGVRDLATIERLLDAGAARVILGTAAVSAPELLRAACARFGGRIAAAIDARDGRVVTEGWTAATPLTVAEAAARVVGAGARRIVYTDTRRDGMLGGPDVASLEPFLAAAAVPVIVAGGVTSAGDLRRLRRLEPAGLEGAVVGRALYEGSVRLQDLLAAAAGDRGPA
ncbi:MAG TPA: 1-(5-phosphoribosyl)-5-[(5-phosphoribosylamino)methylideneamino]imidazole-4-carboxamide isomerase [bacterium]|nr:1-(5-phosphoribosyl)-5-[(5-phosphoribosylamino)methylideneamino]imidazole-4-carboxamide isomerase [bacterium]